MQCVPPAPVICCLACRSPHTSLDWELYTLCLPERYATCRWSIKNAWNVINRILTCNASTWNDIIVQDMWDLVKGRRHEKLFQQVQHEGLTELCYFCGCSECICQCRCTRREQACWWKDQPKQLCMWEIALLTWMFWTGSTWCPWRIWLRGVSQPWHMWNVAKVALKCCRLCAAIQHISFWWQQDLHSFNFRDWQGEWRNK